MDLGLRDKVVLVTGSSSGIAAGIARALVALIATGEHEPGMTAFAAQ